MNAQRVSTALITTLLATAAAGRAHAQLGSGWKEFTPEKTIQLRGAGAKYTNENGIETFSTQPGDERAEARIVNDHRNGTWQFEGWVNVKAGVNGGCVHQVFKFLMIVAYPDGGGELRQHSYQKLAATGIYDKWVRVNTIHDPDAGRADVYIDGTWRGMVRSTSPGPEGWYHKYGIYNSSGTRPVVQWRDVKFFKDGQRDGFGSNADAGAPTDARTVDFGPSPTDARSDARPADGAGADSFGGNLGGMGGGGSPGGTGGAGGTGAGGSGAGGSGAGGSAPTTAPTSAGGRGGGSRPGAGGAPGAPPGSPSDSSGCGCRIGDGQSGDGAASTGAAALALLAVASVVRSQRSRRRRS